MYRVDKKLPIKVYFLDAHQRETYIERFCLSKRQDFLIRKKKRIFRCSFAANAFLRAFFDT